ncbi:FAD-dependent oxidoreductase [Streptomyces coeruleorubidus]|uniref:FAD-dependent oxidoreductase n=1 Tax=Streptomyces coeruleorubidus TaxID=116188 RepID=UPI0033DC0311
MAVKSQEVHVSSSTGKRNGEEILIVGAGVVGASVAHHLTRLGHDRVTVLDARDVPCSPDRPDWRPASWASSARLRS